LEKIVNIAVQFLPINQHQDFYSLIDKAIEVIKKSGVKHVVCPFETVLEGTYPQLMELINKMQDVCMQEGATELLVNLKIHRSKDTDILIDNKLEKYI